MGSSKKPKQTVTLYYMSQHFGICHGPLDFIKKIVINEKTAWVGTKSTQGDIVISKPDLFGGAKKEGGAVGTVHYLPGGPDQTIPENIAAKHGKTTATMPAYRGIASAFFHGGKGGFYWSANSPYLPGVWIEAARASVGLGQSFARIWREKARKSRIITDVARWGSSNGSKLFDVYESTVAYVTRDESKLIIEDLRTGNRRAAITLAAEPMWVFISPSRNEVLSLDINGVMRAYDLANGAAKSSLSLGVPPFEYGGQWLGGPTEILIGGATYLFFLIGPLNLDVPIVCCKSAGGGWTKLWQQQGAWGITASHAQLSVSPEYIVLTTYYVGQTYRVGWTEAGLGETVSITSLVTSTTAQGQPSYPNSIAYLAPHDKWFVVGGGYFAVLNSDLIAVVASGQTGKTGNATIEYVQGRHVLDGPGVAVIFEDGVVFSIDLATGEIFESIQDDEWNLNIGGKWDAGFSASERAIAVYSSHHSESIDSIYVLFLPSESFDSNPAHIIYECLTNTDWGMGAPATAIDVASFESAAATLYGEEFGLSMLWTQQDTIENFVKEALDHIEAVLFVNPKNGLLTLKLIRDDYDIDALPVFTPDNSVVTKFARKLWGETINEIVVTFTNPENEEEETVSAQDLANIEAQGGIVSDGRNYYGVRVKALATKLAHRDLRAASTPIASCDIEANREAWNLLPGDCLKLHSPDDGIDNIIMRVGPVDYGKPGDSTVRAPLVEDIFSLPLADYNLPPDSEWVPVSEEPTPADHTLVFTLPYYLVINEVDQTVLNAGWAYPETFAGVLAAEAGQDTPEFELFEADGDELGTKTIVSRAELAADIPAEALSVLPAFPDRTQGNPPTVGGLILIEGTGEGDSELCAITGEYPAGYTVERGVLDTVPRAWPAGTPVWFIDANLENTDDIARAEAEIVQYKVLTRTSLGLLDFNAAPTVSHTVLARPHLPLRPADVRVSGDPGFAGAVDQDGVDPVPVTWSRRNRLTEDAVIMPWDAADVAPEDGQATRVDVLGADGSILTTHDDLAGTSFDVPVASFAGNSRGVVRVSAKRDDLVSLQAHEIEVIVATGYGYGYGYNYGGA